DWAAKQFRMIVPGDQAHRFVIYDRDTFTRQASIALSRRWVWRCSKTPARIPQANTFCERLIGTMRRECLDFVIPMTERHLRAILHEWISHYNRGRIRTDRFNLSHEFLAMMLGSTRPTVTVVARTLQTQDSSAIPTPA